MLRLESHVIFCVFATISILLIFFGGGLLHQHLPVEKETPLGNTPKTCKCGMKIMLDSTEEWV